MDLESLLCRVLLQLKRLQTKQKNNNKILCSVLRANVEI